MSDDELDELRTLANGNLLSRGQAWRNAYLQHINSEGLQGQYARYISACSPDTIVRLIDRLKTAEEAMKE